MTIMTHHRLCLCGCGEAVKRRFKQGHDQRLRKAIEESVEGIEELKLLVEDLVGHPIVADQPDK